MTATTENLLTVQEVMARLKCSRDTAYKLMREGKLRSFNLGRRRRVREGDFLAFVEALAGKGTGL